MPRAASVIWIACAIAVLAVGVTSVFGVGCSSSDVGTDLGVVEPGCRAPSACYKIGADCPCDRADVEGACKVCDPQAEVCTCAIGTACLEPSQVCVGRAATACTGVGARCLPAGSSCAESIAGEPPQLVGSGSDLAPRCPYVDDVCCTGVVLDLSSAD